MRLHFAGSHWVVQMTLWLFSQSTFNLWLQQITLWIVLSPSRLCSNATWKKNRRLILRHPFMHMANSLNIVLDSCHFSVYMGARSGMHQIMHKVAKSKYDFCFDAGSSFHQVRNMPTSESSPAFFLVFVYRCARSGMHPKKLLNRRLRFNHDLNIDFQPRQVFWV